MLIPYLYASPNYLAKSGPVTQNHLKHRQDGETQERLQRLLTSHLDAGQCGDRSEIDPYLSISRLRGRLSQTKLRLIAGSWPYGFTTTLWVCALRLRTQNSCSLSLGLRLPNVGKGPDGDTGG